jgi:hypothetical protein
LWGKTLFNMLASHQLPLKGTLSGYHSILLDVYSVLLYSHGYEWLHTQPAWLRRRADSCSSRARNEQYSYYERADLLSRELRDIPSLELCTLLASMQGGGQGLYEMSGLAITPAKEQC